MPVGSFPPGSIALVQPGIERETPPEETRACLFTSRDAPGLHIALIGHAVVLLANVGDPVRDSSGRMLHLNLGAERSETSRLGTIQVMRCRAVATDSNNRAYHIVAAGQVQGGFLLVSLSLPGTVPAPGVPREVLAPHSPAY